MSFLKNSHHANNLHNIFITSNIFLIVCLLISILSTLFFSKKIEKSQNEIYNLYREKFKSDAELIFQIYVNPLNGIASSYHISPGQFNAQSFKNSSEARNMFKDFHGALGFGFIRRIKSLNTEVYLSQMIKDNPDFELKRLSQKKKGDELYVIEMVEPAAPNKKAIGLVISDEENRRKAAEEAMKNGIPIITHSIQLVQSQKMEPGFLLFKPIYETTKTPEEESERVRKLVGWAYSPILASALIADIKEKNPNIIIFSIDEIDPSGKQNSIYADTKNNNLSSEQRHNLEIYVTNKKWVVSLGYNLPGTWSSAQKSAILFTILLLFSITVFFFIRQVEMKNKFNSELLLETQMQVSKATSELLLLQKNEKLQQARLYAQSKLSLVGEMAGGIAHEINNPLAIIKGKARIMALKLDSDSIPIEIKNTLEKNLKSIDMTINRISAIVKALRSISRDSEQDPHQEVNFSEILATVNDIFSEKLKSKNIHFAVFSDENNLALACNKVQIEQVILNLLSNSAYAVEKLEERWIHIIVQRANELLKVRVVDSGHGISQKILEKMMEPFFTTKPVGDGTGLGLSICRGIIEKHHGTIDYELYQGHTSFILIIPLNIDQKKMIA